MFFLSFSLCSVVLSNAAYKQFMQIMTDSAWISENTAFIMRKKKTILDESGNARNGKPSRCGPGNATPVKLGAACTTVEEKTSTSLWLYCLIGVSLLSLLTRLYNLHQPASVWLVWIFWVGYCFVHCFCVTDNVVFSELAVVPRSILLMALTLPFYNLVIKRTLVVCGSFQPLGDNSDR